MKTEVSITFEAKFEYDEDAKVHLAFAPALDVITQADTHGEAQNALVDAIQQHLRIAFRQGTIENLLERWGIQPSVSLKVTRTVEPERETDTFHIPVFSSA